MAKILISSLGKTLVGKYEPTTYRFSDGKNYKTPFITDALSKYIKVDKVFLIGTNNSMWQEAYRYFARADEEEQAQKTYIELDDKGKMKEFEEEDLNSLNLAMDAYLKRISRNATGGSYCKIIDYGLNEQELLNNFSTVMDLMQRIQQGDELYLDITHGFRSIPLFMYVMLDFIQHLRQKDNIQVKGIYYGMFEESKRLGFTPVVNLNSMFELMQWTKGIYEFINYGQGYLLADLVDSHGLKNSLNTISDLLNLNFIKKLRSEVDKMIHRIEKDQIDSHLPMIKHLLPYLENFVRRFKGVNSDAEFQFRLAEWYFENKRYSHGYICLAESILTSITSIYTRVEKELFIEDVTVRNTVKKVFNHLNSDKNALYRKISEIYDDVRKIRNNIAHAGFEYKDDKEEIDKAAKYMNQVKKLIFNKNQTKLLQSIPDLYPYSLLKEDVRRRD